MLLFRRVFICTGSIKNEMTFTCSGIINTDYGITTRCTQAASSLVWANVFYKHKRSRHHYTTYLSRYSRHYATDWSHHTWHTSRHYKSYQLYIPADMRNLCIVHRLGSREFNAQICIHLATLIYVILVCTFYKYFLQQLYRRTYSKYSSVYI